MKSYNFVYKTICVTTGHYYFGVHSTNNMNDNYLGSGLKLINFLKKHGRSCCVREIIKICSTRDEAFKHEKEVLTEYVLSDPLCLNLIEGGTGFHHIYGETFKQRISNTRRSKIKDGVIVPTKHSESHKQRLREHNPGGISTSKAVLQFCPSTGDLIKEWPSSRQAGLSLGIKTWRNISVCCNIHPTRIVGGYYWRWVSDSSIENNKLKDFRFIDKRRKGKPVLQIDTNGSIVKVWNSNKEATNALNLSISNITWAIKTNKIAGGFFWKYATCDDII